MTDDEKFVQTVEKLSKAGSFDPDLERRDHWLFRSPESWSYEDVLWAASEAVREIDLEDAPRRELKERLWLLQQVFDVAINGASEEETALAVFQAVADIAERAGRLAPEQARVAVEVRKHEAAADEARTKLALCRTKDPD